MKLKKLLCLALAALMVLSLFAGCAQKTEEPAPSEATPASETPAEAAPTEQTPSEEPVVDPAETETREMSYMESLGFISDFEAKKLAESLDIVPTTEYFPLAETGMLTATHVYAPFVTANLPTGDMNEKLVFSEFEKMTNVHVDWTGISMMSASEDYQLLIASGDYPDIIFSFGGFMNGVSYESSVEDEILVDLNPLIPQYCPSYNYMLTNNKDVRLGATTSAGYLPEFIGTDVGVTIYNADYIRQDWLDEMGAELPQTYDELHEILVAFRDDYGCQCPMWIPDNGIDDKLLPGYGVVNNWYLDDGGDIIYGPVQEGFREYLKMMNQWYKEGLFSVEFMSLDNDFDATSADFINNGVAGVFFTKFDTLSNFDAESSGDPDFATTPIGCMTKKAGDEITVMENGAQTFAYGGGWTITTSCEDLELACRWCDFWYTEAGSMLANYGVEGYTYNYDEDGRPIWTEEVTDNPNMSFQPAVATMMLYKGGGYVSDSWKELQAYSEELISADLAAMANQVGGNALPNSLKMTGEEETEKALYNTDVETAVEENTLCFITGSLDINDDAAWQTYVDTVNSLGLEKIHDIEVTVYQRYLES